MKPNASFTEFCGALLTGILPTNEGGSSVRGGGANNLPRYLEDWGGVTHLYRGALSCAFESEIQNDPWGGSYYNPPRREWGYFNRFEEGELPPGTPSFPSYRKGGFKFLTKEEFEAAIDALPWTVTVPALP